MKLRKVLLATDFTAASALATEHAISLAAQSGAHLLLVSVVEPTDHTARGAHRAVRIDHLRDRRQESAIEVVNEARSRGIPCSFLVWAGDAGESIVAASEAEEVDLVIVGTHGRGRIGRLLLGSVSDHVVRHAPCPVLVVRDVRTSVVAGATEWHDDIERSTTYRARLDGERLPRDAAATTKP